VSKIKTSARTAGVRYPCPVCRGIDTFMLQDHLPECEWYVYCGDCDKMHLVAEKHPAVSVCPDCKGNGFGISRGIHPDGRTFYTCDNCRKEWILKKEDS